MRNAFYVEHLSDGGGGGGPRRRSIFFIYDGDLSCEYLGYVIIVIIHCQTILQIARTVCAPAPPQYRNCPEGFTNINKRIVFLIFCSHSASLINTCRNIYMKYWQTHHQALIRPRDFPVCHPVQPVLLWLIGGGNKKHANCCGAALRGLRAVSSDLEIFITLLLQSSLYYDYILIKIRERERERTRHNYKFNKTGRVREVRILWELIFV